MRRLLLLRTWPVAVSLGCSSHLPSGTGAGDSAVDAATQDSALDSAAGGDASEGSATGDAGPTGCMPGDVSAFHPSWHPPATPRPSCTEPELDDLVADCFEVASSVPSCDTFQQASAGCWACMVTPDTGVAWGAIVESSLTGLDYGNFAGCLALKTGDHSPSGCAALQQASRLCSEVACSGPQCFAEDPLEVPAVQQCQQDALAGGCASYESAAEACVEGLIADGGVGAAAARFCSAGTYGDSPTYYRALGTVFCLAPTGIDAGAEGGGNDAGDSGP